MALAERFQPSTLHKLRHLGRCTNTDTPDTAYQLDAEAAPAEVAYTRINTQLSCSGVGESDGVLTGGHNHTALAERFQPSTLHKLRQLDRCTNTDTPDTAYQLDAEAVPAEVAYTRINTQLSCSGVGESECVVKGGHDMLTPSYIVTLTDAPTIFNVGLQGLTAQSTMEA